MSHAAFLANGPGPAQRVLYSAHAEGYIRRVRRRRIAIVGAIAAVAVLVAIALLPGLAARSVARRLSRSLGTPVRVGWLSWHPLSGTWILRGVRVDADHGPPALLSRRVTARLHLWDALHGRYHVRTLTVEGARLRLRARPQGWEIPLPAPPTAAAADAPAMPTVLFDWVTAPRATVRLEPQQGIRSLLRMRELELTGRAGAEVRLTLWTRGRLDRGSIAFAGRMQSKDDARRLRLRLSARDLDLGRILRLTEGTPVRDLRGRVDLRAKYDEAGHADALQRVATGRLVGRDVALRARDVEGLWVRGLEVPRFHVDVGRQHIALDDVELREPEVWIRRRGAHFTIAGLLDTKATSKDAAASVWTVNASSTALKGGVVHHIDAESGRQTLDVSIEQAELGALAAPSVAVPFSFDATIGTGGRVSARGEAVREPFGVTGQARLSDVVLPPLVALSGSPLQLDSGTTSASLTVGLHAESAEGSGTITVRDLKTISPDPARPEEVMAFKEMRLVVRGARTAPVQVSLGKLDLDWPYVLLDRTETGLFPVSLASRPATSPDAAAAAPNTSTLRIDELAVLGGRIDFRDATLTPPYWRSLANFKLTAKGVEAPGVRVVELRGSGLVDELSPLRLEGTIGTRTHLVAEVERLALPPFNAYLEGTAPYTVRAGAVSGRSEIVLDRSELEVNNRIVLSRLGLAGGGGPDFVKRELGIPLTLALALMKDYRGNIELTLPFGGNLQEPTFSMRSVVLQAIVRAIRGAILSPLNALGRVVLRDGRIERFDLDPIPFPPGGRELDEIGRERTAQISRVLWARPDLAVRLRGQAAIDDLEKLKDEAALSALTDDPMAEPLRAFLRARLDGAPPPPLDEGLQARLETVRAHLPWPGEALRNLAVDRGAVAAAALILEFKVDPERVAAAPPEAPQPNTLAAHPGAAVELHEH